MKVAILTLGCKTNQAESFHWEAFLGREGHRIVELEERPDICIINTCTVTAKADYQSRQLIQRALRNKARVIVTGCYAELRGDEIRKLDDTIRVVQNSDKQNIGALISSDTLTRTLALPVYPRQRPIVKVQDGCDFSCSYCAITMARGRSRSVLPEEVISEVRSYEAAGYGEIVLTGIHLGLYGLDLVPRLSLSGLLKKLLHATHKVRFRLSSLEIKEVNEEILDLLSDRRLCRHLHLSIQSGDDTVLSLMRRRYRREDLIAGLGSLVKRQPDCGLGADIIAGFPGEGEEEFRNTRELLEAFPFSYIHAFPYSRRPGTEASSYPGQVSDEVKKRRAEVLRAIGETKRTGFIQSQSSSGKTFEVIVEQKERNGFTATSDNYIKVFLDTSAYDGPLREGMLIFARLTGHHNGRALGMPINSGELLNK